MVKKIFFLDQLGALEAAHEDRLLDKQREYVALGQLLFMHKNPPQSSPSNGVRF
ncbi:MAG: hypothetical protein Ct9H300mP20_00480 [Gammaproteobacteria bacterium]|nr:MAG: hypothetical protein Ct9H300mP20_00480 [Gammaproteobacteria bacterium]